MQSMIALFKNNGGCPEFDNRVERLSQRIPKGLPGLRSPACPTILEWEQLLSNPRLSGIPVNSVTIG